MWANLLFESFGETQGLYSTNPGSGKAPLFHGDAQGPRGATAFDDTRAVIHFFEAKNLSTAPHEIYHVFRRVLHDMAMAENSPAWVKEDWAAACDFVGAEIGAEWTTEQEEKWARAGEAYLREGKAPSKELRGVFARFRKWLMVIYRTLSGMNVRLSDDMRGVFDRMLATDVEIAEAKQRMEFWPALDESMAGADYVSQARKAALVGEEAIQNRRTAERDKRIPGWRKQAEQEVRADEDVQLLDRIMAAGGIDEATLDAAIDKDVVKRAKSRRPGKIILSEKGLADAERLANEFGFDSAADLVYRLADIRPMREKIEARVAELEAEWDAGFDPEQALLTEEYERLLEMEQAIMADEAGAKVMTSAEIRRAAQARVGRSAVQKILQHHADVLKGAVRRARLAADRAYRQGKKDEAARAKERQRKAVAELKARYKAKEEVRKALAAMKREAKSKTVEFDHLQHIQAILHHFGLTTTGPKRPDAMVELGEFLAQQSQSLFDAEGATSPSDSGVADWIVSSMRLGQRSSWKGLSLEQIRDVRDAVKALAHQGRTARQLILGETRVLAADRVAQIVSAMSPLKDRGQLTEAEERTLRGRLRRFVHQIGADLQIPEFLIRMADGFRKGADIVAGPMYRTFMQPLADARGRELTLHAEKAAELREALATLEDDGTEFEIPGVPLKERVRQRWGGRWTMSKVFAVALNMGNRGNRDALIHGFGWHSKSDPEAGNRILDKIVERVTDEQWDAIERVWRLVDSMFSLVDDAHYAVKGVRLTKVQAEPFTTPTGRSVRGGYYPLIFDQRFSGLDQAAAIQASELMNYQSAIFQRPTAKAGFTKERTGGRMPPRLDLSVISKHLWDAIHYGTHAVALRDAYLVAKDEGFRTVFEAKFGEAQYRKLIDWMRYVARPERDMGDEMTRLVDSFRRKATVFTLGLNARTAAVQMSAVFHGMQELGVSRTLRAIAWTITHRRTALRQVEAMSAEMANRRKSLDREISQTMSKYNPAGKALRVGKLSVTWEGFHNFCFAMIRFMDMTAALPVWVAAHDRATSEGRGEQAAVAYANAMVRQTQASAEAISMPAWQRSEQAWKRLFGMFMTYSLMFQGRVVYNWKGLREGKVSFGEWLQHVLYDMVLPQLYISLVLAMFESGPLPWGDDDEDRWAKEYGLDMLGFWLSGLPFLRNLTGAVRYNSDLTDTPGLEVIDRAYLAGKKGMELLSDAISDDFKLEDFWRFVRYSTDGIGLYYGIPTRWAWQFQDGMQKWIEGDTKNPFRLFFKEDEKK